MKLTDEDIKNISAKLSNALYFANLIATRQLTDLFDKITKHPLNAPQDYVQMYDANFYTYKTWGELIESEQYCSDGLTPSQCFEQLNITIWQLPCGWYIQYI